MCISYLELFIRERYSEEDGIIPGAVFLCSCIKLKDSVYIVLIRHNSDQRRNGLMISYSQSE